jgi:hypothetical protein
MNRSIRFLWGLVALIAPAALVGCGRPFDVKTANGFVELENQEGHGYQYRATTPEGVVVGVRVVDGEKRGDLAFWQQTLTLQLRDVAGYALLGVDDVASRDGTKGKRLRFGHDEDGKPYLYSVTFYLAQSRLFLVESGAAKTQMERAAANVELIERSVRVQCGGFPAPVFTSSTCNRWID